MPIEFRCTGCQKLLRTQDATAGKQAKCPVCGTLSLIPDPDLPPPLPGETPPPLPAGAVSPTGAAGPTGATVPIATPVAHVAGGPPGARPPLVARPIDVFDLLTTAWRIFYGNMGICIAAGILLAIISGALTGGLGELDENQQPGLVPHFSFFLFGGPWWVPLSETLVHSLLFSGQAFFFLKIARGQPAAIPDLFAGWRWILQAFLATLIVGLIVTVGIILCFVPGIIAALMLSQTLYFVVDRNAGALEAMDFSREVTHGNKLYLFLLAIVVGIAAVLASIPCGLGLIFFVPWLFVLAAVTHLRLTGQPVAGEGDRLQA